PEGAEPRNTPAYAGNRNRRHARPAVARNTPAYAGNTLLDLHVSWPKPGFACGLHSRTHAFPVSPSSIMDQIAPQRNPLLPSATTGPPDHLVQPPMGTACLVEDRVNPARLVRHVPPVLSGRLRPQRIGTRHARH